MARLWDRAIPLGGGLLPAELPPRWPDKPAGAMLDYSFDVSPLLASPMDRIVTADVVALVCVVRGVTAQGGLVTVWLAGGAPGQSDKVSITVTTACGRTVRRVVVLPII